MAENITGKLLMAIAIGAAFGLFYTQLLSMHGFTRIKYKHVAFSIGAVIFLLGLYSFEAAGIACFIIGIGIFVLAIALMARGTDDPQPQIFLSGKPVQDYDVAAFGLYQYLFECNTGFLYPVCFFYFRN